MKFMSWFQAVLMLYCLFLIVEYDIGRYFARETNNSSFVDPQKILDADSNKIFLNMINAGTVFESVENYKVQYVPEILHFNTSNNAIDINVSLINNTAIIRISCKDNCYDIQDMKLVLYDDLNNIICCSYTILNIFDKPIATINLRPNTKYELYTYHQNFDFDLRLKFRTKPMQLTNFFLAEHLQDNVQAVIIFNVINEDYNVGLYMYEFENKTIMSANLTYHRWNSYNHYIDLINLRSDTYYLLQLTGSKLDKSYNIIWKTRMVIKGTDIKFYPYEISYTENQPSFDQQMQIELLFLRYPENGSYTVVPVEHRGEYEHFYFIFEKNGQYKLVVTNNNNNDTRVVVEFVTDLTGELGLIRCVRVDSSVYCSLRQIFEAQYKLELVARLFLFNNSNSKTNYPILSKSSSSRLEYIMFEKLAPKDTYTIRICLRPYNIFCLKNMYGYNIDECEHCRDARVSIVDINVEYLRVSQVNDENQLIIDFKLNKTRPKSKLFFYVYAARENFLNVVSKRVSLDIFLDVQIVEKVLWFNIAAGNTTDISGSIILNFNIKDILRVEFLDSIHKGYPYALVIFICKDDSCYASKIFQAQQFSTLRMVAFTIIFWVSVFISGIIYVLAFSIIFKRYESGYMKLDIKCNIDDPVVENLETCRKVDSLIKSKHLTLLDIRKNDSYVECRHIYPIENEYVGSDENGYIYRVINNKKPKYYNQKICIERQISIPNYRKYANVFLMPMNTYADDFMDFFSEYDLDPNDKTAVGGIPYRSYIPDLVEGDPYENSKLELAVAPGLYGPASYIIGSVTSFEMFFNFICLLFDHKVKTVVFMCSDEFTNNHKIFKLYFVRNRKFMKTWTQNGIIFSIFCLKSSKNMDEYALRIDKKNDETKVQSIVETRIFHYRGINCSEEVTDVGNFLKFRNKVVESHGNTKYPMVVLCTNGCGLSSSYITIDYNINLLEAGSEFVNITGYIVTLREIITKAVCSISFLRFIFEALSCYLKIPAQNASD